MGSGFNNQTTEGHQLIWCSESMWASALAMTRDLAFVAVLRAVEGAEELIRLRTLVLTVFMVAWLATGIAAGIVMGRRRRRRHDHFPWWLLGVAFGALMVPLALGRDRREQLTGRASSLPASPDRPVPALVGIDDRRHAALS